MKKIMSILLVIMIAALGMGIYTRRMSVSGMQATPSATAVPSATLPAASTAAAASPTAEATATALPSASTEPAVLDDAVFSDTSSLLLLANKKHPLPEGYAPSDLAYPDVRKSSSSLMLRYEAAVALEEMFAAAANDGVTLVLDSAFRSAEVQASLYSGYASKYGTARADAISSRAGYSDHQTGLACDITQAGNTSGYNYTQNFELTDEAIWLREHAHEYGFIMRYPKGKQDITGYAYEPWHFRYVGKDYAAAIYAVDEYESFEEYFHVEGGDYAE